MLEDIPEWRPKLFVGEGEHVRNAFLDNGYGDTIRSIDAIRGIDTRALGQVASQLYGTAGNALEQYVASRDPDLETDPATGRVPTKLATIAVEMEDEFGKVGENWHGPACTAASNYNTSLRKVTELEGHRSALLGESIHKFASAVEEAAEDAEETVLGVANLLYATAGVGVSIGTGGSAAILMAGAGLIGAGAEKSQAAAERHKKELEETAEETLNIKSESTGRLIEGSDPADLMPEFPEGVEGWRLGE